MAPSLSAGPLSPAAAASSGSSTALQYAAYVAVFGALVAVLVLLDALRHRAKSRGLPPSPRRLPIIGNLAYMAGTLVWETLDNFHRSVGRPGMISLHLGERLAVMVFDLKIMGKILRSKQARNRPNFRFRYALAPDSMMCDSFSKEYPKRKAALMTSLLQNKNLEHQGHDAVFDEGADQMIVNLERRMREQPDAATSGMSAHEVIQHANINVLLELTFNLRWDIDSESYKRIAAAGEEVRDVAALPACPSDFFPSWAPDGPVFTKLKTTAAKRDALLRPHLADAVATFDPSAPPRHFIDRCLLMRHEAMEKGNEELATAFTDSKIFDNIVGDVMITAGDSNANIFDWFCVYMVLNPDWQELAYREIETHCESHDGTVSVKNFRHLEVVRAVILETMRMRSVEIGLPRELAEDLEIDGYRLPARTVIMTNHFALGRDERLWHEPLKFNPRRFMHGDEDGDGEGLGNPDMQYFFGLGARRSCPGKELSTAAIILYAARILQKFRMSLPADIDASAANDDYDPKMDKPTPLLKRYVFTPRERGDAEEGDLSVMGERSSRTGVNYENGIQHC